MFLPIQLGAVFCAVLVFALAPPAQGRMLLVPILPGSGAHLAADAIDRGAHLVAPGPAPGSIVVDGTRSRIVPGMLWRGVIPMTAVFVDCGDPKGGAR
ncbi:MAG: hypothetical protein ACTHJR_17085 [Sphingomonas sp.]